MAPRPESLTGGAKPKPNISRPCPVKFPKLSRESIKEEEWRAFLRQDYPMLGLRQITCSRIFLVVNHLMGAYGLYLILTGKFSFGILLFEFIYAYFGALGTTIGAHRLWTHKSFKATLPLKIILMCWQSITVQYSLYKWCLDHRIHHKFTDTSKDPHNSKRGFLFSHITWTVTPRTPEHLEELKRFDMPDLEKDPVILFQSRWYPWLVVLFYNLIPVQFVCYFWSLPEWPVHCLNCLRWCYGTHISAAVNSFAHIYGDKPYDQDLTSTDNGIVALFSVGEGWHNYHHTFPWDYKASELGLKFNFSTLIINLFAKIGWAYDMKTVNEEMLREKVERSGDGSHPIFGTAQEEEADTSNEFEANEMKLGEKNMDCDTKHAWGWGDGAISDEFRKMTTILNRVEETKER